LSVPAGYLLDTHVISETRKKRPHEAVSAFLARAPARSLFTSVLVVGELRKGVAGRRLTDPAGADALADWVDLIETRFADRVLPIDTWVARIWGEWSAGRVLPVVDTLLAATASVHGLVLVTRNVRDVADTGVEIINPWEAPA
jgi:hypothetical protein